MPRSPERHRPGGQETKWYLVALGQLKSEPFSHTGHNLESSTILWLCEETPILSKHQEVHRKPAGLWPAKWALLGHFVGFVMFPRKPEDGCSRTGGWWQARLSLGYLRVMVHLLCRLEVVYNHQRDTSCL